MASRLKRSLPVTVNDVLDGQVKLDLECLDRLVLPPCPVNLRQASQRREVHD
jgi:hypothetical protein